MSKASFFLQFLTASFNALHNRILMFAVLGLMCISANTQAQQKINIWPAGQMPNTKGLQLKEVVDNERITQVDTPAIFAFFTSKEENTGAAILILPSGGYHHLTYNWGGFQIAKWFNTMGVNAFVLNYRLPTSPDLVRSYEGPIADAQQAIKLIRSHAADWALAPQKIGVFGTSAGGHLATTLCTTRADYATTTYTADTLGFRPDFAVLVSPVISMGEHTHAGSRTNLLGEKPTDALVAAYSNELQVSALCPPTFLAHAANDKSVSVRNSLLYYTALLDSGVAASLHIFPQGGHSIALRHNPGSTRLWTELCEEWLRESGFINNR